MDELKAERNELNVLINKGLNFNVERKVFKRQKGFLGYFKKKIEETETLTFTIKEPTLATLDRLSAEQINLSIDESLMVSDNAVSESKKIANKHSKLCAKIIAIAVLGQDYLICEQYGSSFKYRNDDKKLNELTELFFMNIKPSVLLQLYILVNTISNLSDFINSIRLMSASRTTMPIRIED